jgi:hypothetical protein
MVGRGLGLVEQLAPEGRPLQVMVGLAAALWNVIVVEADEPAVTVTLLGSAESVTVGGTALTGLIRPTTNSKIKPTENSKTLSLTKHVTKHHSPRHALKTNRLKI